MRILVIAALFPPDARGGAELGAYNSALWLRRRGHEVAVLTTAASPDQELNGENVDSLRIWRSWRRRPYPRIASDNASFGKKLLWHIQDHLDPANVYLMAKVVAQFRPDIALIHLVPGIGHNSLKALNDAQIPVVYYLHDLGLACFRGSMYKGGVSCPKQCVICRCSSANTMRFIVDPARYTFIGTSRSNLNAVKSLVNISSFPSTLISDLDLDEPLPRIPRHSSSPVQLMYVGRLHVTKGVDFLIDVLESLHKDQVKFHLTLVGSGPLEKHLREEYAGRPWLTFVGRVPPHEVKNHLRNSDLLCVPSVWRENHPGVVRQALRAGVPVLASDRGGTPEMIVDGETGLILPALDHESWKRAFLKIINDSGYLQRLQTGAAKAGSGYSVDALGIRLETTLEEALARAGQYRSNASIFEPAKIV